MLTSELHMDWKPNLFVAWLWILLGFGSGLVLGLFFGNDGWLGGYASFRRRLYRLAHISFFGLGAANLLFWLTAQELAAGFALGRAASWAFVVGALTMPPCCIVVAHRPKAHGLFAVPVVSLLIAGALMLAWVAGAGQGTLARTAM